MAISCLRSEVSQYSWSKSAQQGHPARDLYLFSHPRYLDPRRDMRRSTLSADLASQALACIGNDDSLPIWQQS